MIDEVETRYSEAARHEIERRWQNVTAPNEGGTPLSATAFLSLIQFPMRGGDWEKREPTEASRAWLHAAMKAQDDIQILLEGIAFQERELELAKRGRADATQQAEGCRGALQASLSLYGSQVGAILALLCRYSPAESAEIVAAIAEHQNKITSNFLDFIDNKKESGPASPPPVAIKNAADGRRPTLNPLAHGAPFPGPVPPSPEDCPSRIPPNKEGGGE